MNIIKWMCDRTVFRPGVDFDKVRWLDWGDEDYALFQQFTSRQLPREHYARIRNKDIRLSAIIEDRKIISMAYETPCSEDARVVNGVLTLPAFRKKGHAKAVVSFVTTHILAAGRVGALWTRDDQPAMIRIAESLGYKQCEIVNVIKWKCDNTSFRPADFSKVRWLDWGDEDYPFPRERYEEMHYWGGARLSAIIEDRKIVSMAYEQPHTEDVSEVVSVQTLQSFRRKGHAKAVVSFVTAHILADGRLATMETCDDNLAMIRVAESLGYKRSEQPPAN